MRRSAQGLITFFQQNFFFIALLFCIKSSATKCVRCIFVATPGSSSDVHPGVFLLYL